MAPDSLRPPQNMLGAAAGHVSMSVRRALCYERCSESRLRVLADGGIISFRRLLGRSSVIYPVEITAPSEKRIPGASARLSRVFKMPRARHLAASLARVRLTMSVRWPSESDAAQVGPFGVGLDSRQGAPGVTQLVASPSQVFIDNHSNSHFPRNSLNGCKSPY
jgi:hypothetical protein